MADFNILRGKEKALPQQVVDGNLYVCTDTGSIFVDYSENNTVKRTQLAGSNSTNIIYKKILLTSSGWDSDRKTQRCNLPEINAPEDETGEDLNGQLITITPYYNSKDDYYNSGIMCTSQFEGGLEFTAQEMPQHSIYVLVKIESLNKGVQ